MVMLTLAALSPDETRLGAYTKSRVDSKNRM
jgi:hypothetical protein